MLNEPRQRNGHDDYNHASVCRVAVMDVSCEKNLIIALAVI